MRACPMIIGAVSREVMFQAAFIEHDQVIQALASDAADHALDIRPLPRRTGSRQDLLDSHSLHLFYELMAEDAVAITQQILGCALPRKGFPELVSSPLGSRMRCH